MVGAFFLGQAFPAQTVPDIPVAPPLVPGMALPAWQILEAWQLDLKRRGLLARSAEARALPMSLSLRLRLVSVQTACVARAPSLSLEVRCSQPGTTGGGLAIAQPLRLGMSLSDVAVRVEANVSVRSFRVPIALSPVEARNELSPMERLALNMMLE